MLVFGYAFLGGGVTYGERFDIRFKTLSSRMRKLGYVCGVLTSALAMELINITYQIYCLISYLVVYGAN